jgi:hypothetical protein
LLAPQLEESATGAERLFPILAVGNGQAEAAAITGEVLNLVAQEATAEHDFADAASANETELMRQERLARDPDERFGHE